ncbi:MAG: FAD-dependent oxidoreductase [Pseudomonadota bacterium]
MNCDILIIGGGLSGLSLASRLAREGADFQLVEARDRLGGRILSAQAGATMFDLGPAWFWPGQPRINQMVDQLGLERFDQFDTGLLSVEDEHGHVRRGQSFAGMQRSFRLEGGMAALVDAIARSVPRDTIHLSTPVTRLENKPDRIAVTCGSNPQILARRVVIAAPPRLAAQLPFTPQLPNPALQSLHEIPTWMAGQAKAVAVYDTPFWQEAGLSGDAMSARGPLVEIHDASPRSVGPYALFGFVGLRPEARQDLAVLQTAIRTQLGRLFGPEAATPKQLIVKDWAFDEFTSTAADLAPLHHHPRYGRPESLNNMWGNRLLFAGTEMASQFSGYLEGALEAAEAVYHQLTMVEV